jgi:hypothetical protein
MAVSKAFSGGVLAAVFAASAMAATPAPFLTCTNPGSPAASNGINAVDVTKHGDHDYTVRVTKDGQVEDINNLQCDEAKVALSKDNDVLYFTHMTCEQKKFDSTGALLRLDFTRTLKFMYPETDPATVDSYGIDKTYIERTVFQGKPNAVNHYDFDNNFWLTPQEKSREEKLPIQSRQWNWGNALQCRINLK